MIRVAVLDDHPAIRAGLRSLIGSEPDLQVVGTAAEEHELWPLLRTRPTVVVLDLHHPGRNGLALCLEIQRRVDAPGVIVYSSATTSTIAPAAAIAGAGATISKSDPPAALLAAIRAVAERPRVGLTIPPRLKVQAAARLDPADHAVFSMRLAGEPSSEIAATLGMREAAVAARIEAIVSALAPEELRPSARLRGNRRESNASARTLDLSHR